MKMIKICLLSLLLFGLAGSLTPAFADNYSNVISVFKKADTARPFFKNSYGYAVFPTVGKGAVTIGGAYGVGKVYRNGKVTGKASLVKLSFGLQLGGQGFSEIVFFQDKRAYEEFISGRFEFDASASAVAVTAGVQAKAGTDGATAGASAGPATGTQARTKYTKGMAVFVHTWGGLMYEASLGGQKFTYTPL